MRAIRCVRISKAAAAATRKSNKASNDIKGEEETPKGEAKAAAPDLGDSIFNPSSSSIGATYRIPNTSSVIANPFAPQASNNVPSPFSTPAPKPPQPPLPSTDLPDTFAQKAQISPSSPSSAAAKQPWPPLSAFPSPYPSYHLDADYETLDPTTPPSVKTAMEIDAGGGGSKDDEKEAFESTIDKTFQRFADRLAQNPLQVLRYEFGGAPLLYSRSDDVGKLFSPPATTSVSAGSKIKTVAQNSGGGRIPRCQNCASQRVFELQLVPQAIAELEVEEEGLEGMEWGTVILGVCERDCAERGVPDGQVGWAEEWLGVQWEEDAKGGKR